ncbi:MAG: O-antigen ligase family protein [Chlamydiales bacterium]
MSVLRLNVKKCLLFSFAALGPLGNILTPYFFPSSFRAYYFLLPFFPLFFLRMNERLAKIGALLLPFFIYCYISAFLVENFGAPNEPHTLFRLFLLFCQFFFILGAASVLTKKTEIFALLKTYLTFFFLSLAIGYLFYIGYYLKIIPIGLIARFSILTQFGFNLLRFSPGSYPNEYGIVSSFVLALLTLIFLDKKLPTFRFSKKSFTLAFLATFLAFLLTTTRAAYLSFLFAMIYLAWKSGYFLKAFTALTLFVTAMFSLLALFKLNMFMILSAGFRQKINEGSLGDRYFTWQNAIEQVKEHPFWGVGFASLTNIHNVYLQLLFELGVVGTLLLLGSLFFLFIEKGFGYRRSIQDETSHFLGQVQMIGLINVLSFAVSNHNLNHHLTWFVSLLCFASLRLRYLETDENDALLSSRYFVSKKGKRSR